MLLQQLVNGVLLGSTYALLALGLTLVLGVLGLLNLAVGETMMVSAFVGLLLLTQLQAPFPVALAAAIAVGTAVSVMTYFVSFRAVKKEYFTAPILSTIGIGIVLSNLASRVWGSDSRSFPDALPFEPHRVGPVELSVGQVVIILLAVALMGGLYAVVVRTRLGMAIRAISENPRTAALLGVPVERVILVTFALGGALVGAAGVLTGLVFHTINPYSGFDATLLGMTVMVLGGLGNVPGAMLGGLLIGLVETLSVAYVSATFRDALVFLILIGVLVFRPQGLLGTRTHEERV